MVLVTSFNMTQSRPSINVLHSLLENFERIHGASDKTDQDSVIQANFSGNCSMHRNQFNKGFQGSKQSNSTKSSFSLTSHLYLKDKVSSSFMNLSSKNCSFGNFDTFKKDWPTFQICDKLDHITLACFLLVDVFTGKRVYKKFTPTTLHSSSFTSYESSPISSNAWLLDSSVTHHLTPNTYQVPHSSIYNVIYSVSIEDDNTLSITSMGYGALIAFGSDNECMLYVHNILHTTLFSTNVFSI